MANNCYNNLTVHGTEQDLKEFAQQAATETTLISLEKLFPMPEELKETTSPSSDSAERQEELDGKYGATNWYDWCADNWGTKWIDTVESIEKNHESLTYSFDSAWKPPREGFINISPQFPNLVFTLYYEEPGNDFMGEVSFQNGQVLEEHENRYSARHSPNITLDNYKISNEEFTGTVRVIYYEDPSDLHNDNQEEHFIGIGFPCKNIETILNSDISDLLDIKNNELDDFEYNGTNIKDLICEALDEQWDSILITAQKESLEGTIKEKEKRRNSTKI